MLEETCPAFWARVGELEVVDAEARLCTGSRDGVSDGMVTRIHCLR